MKSPVKCLVKCLIKCSCIGLIVATMFVMSAQTADARCRRRPLRALVARVVRPLQRVRVRRAVRGRAVRGRAVRGCRSCQF